jgi:bifunctional DNA-binding transcriptional regulator/antitoxin component of YhaV-PrlF toxin-antitoxin module
MAMNVANSGAGAEGSVDSVANLLAGKMTARANGEPDPSSKVEKGADEDDTRKGTRPAENPVEQPGDEGADAQDDQQGADEAEGNADEDEGKVENNSFDLSEDDMLEVTVDGEVQEISIRELKKAYSAEGAVQKRLKEATDMRKETVTSREKAIADTKKMRDGLLTLVQQIDTALHTPNIPQPSAELRSSNPQAYLRQLEAFQQEQANIQQSRQLLVQTLQENASQIEAMKEAAKQEQVALLQTALEPLSNPSTRADAAKDILDAVSQYGFTEQDMTEVVDHRLYLMAYDAMQYRKLLAKSKGSKPTAGDLKQKVERQARTLKTNAVRKDRPNDQQKAVKRLHVQASQSGKVDDIAALLVQKQQAKR